MFATRQSPSIPELRVRYTVTTLQGPGAPAAEAAELLASVVKEWRRAGDEDDAEVAARESVADGARAVALPRPRQPQVWEGMAPGAALGHQVEFTSPGECDDYELVEVISAIERQKSHLAALQVCAMTELASRETYSACASEPDSGCTEHDSAKAAAQEVSAAVRWTPGHATQRVHQSVTLVESCPATFAALSHGEIDEYRARVIVEETATLAHLPAVRARVEAAAAEVAGGKTGPQLRAWVKRRVLVEAPEEAEEKRKKARSGRRVTNPRPEPDGMASLSMTGPAEDVTAFYTAVDAAARARKAEPDEDRSLEQLRFDVLADLGWAGLEVGHLGCCAAGCGTDQRMGTRRGRAATVHVTVPISSLAGIDDTPAELAGYGPITADVARAIAAQGTLRRLLTDPATGQLLEYGRTRYEPPRHLAEHVIARDRTCRFPTCNWRAEACDIDHTTAFHDDGETSDANTGPLHRAHHNGKTHHGWQLIQPEPGRFVWVSPAGHCYQVDPEVVGPIITDDPGPPDNPPF